MDSHLLNIALESLQSQVILTIGEDDYVMGIDSNSSVGFYVDPGMNRYSD